MMRARRRASRWRCRLPPRGSFCYLSSRRGVRCSALSSPPGGYGPGAAQTAATSQRTDSCVILRGPNACVTSRASPTRRCPARACLLLVSYRPLALAHPPKLRAWLTAEAALCKTCEARRSYRPVHACDLSERARTDNFAKANLQASSCEPDCQRAAACRPHRSWRASTPRDIALQQV